MENIINRISYIEGLAEGFEIDETSKEGRLIYELIDVIAEMAEEIQIAQDEMEEYVDIIEEDLSSLEEYVYDEDYDDDYDEDYDDFDFDDDFYFEEDSDEDVSNGCECGNCGDSNEE